MQKVRSEPEGIPDGVHWYAEWFVSGLVKDVLRIFYSPLSVQNKLSKLYRLNNFAILINTHIA